MIFEDRRDGGLQLAGQLAHLRDEPDLIVVGLPRGGVPVAAEIAEALGAPLDVIVVRKLGVPSQPELAMGAIGEDDIRVVNDRIVQLTGVASDQFAAVERRERAELERRASRFRRGRPRVRLDWRTVIVVDDGVATGSTARAACQVARAEGAGRVILAVPVAPADWTTRLADVADELVATATPQDFAAVGQFYRDFAPTTDDEVIRLLEDAAARTSSGETVPDGTVSGGTASDPSPMRTDADRSTIDDDIGIRVGAATVTGHLTVPPDATGLVIFVHGSGSSRHSPRNQHVAHVLNDAGLATLLFDLLTREEERNRANVFDIRLLADRLAAVAEWARRCDSLTGLRTGFFGASTGAAAALVAAAGTGTDVAAIVSRGGRPDLAGELLGDVRAPTLLIVGSDDTDVLRLNRRALARLVCERRLDVVPGATHLFEEPGTLDAAAELACDWFLAHLAGA